MSLDFSKINIDPDAFKQVVLHLGEISQKISATSSTPLESAARFQRVLNFMVQAIEVAAEFTEAAAPIAAVVGMAMGQPEIAVGAKLAGSIASRVDDAIDVRNVAEALSGDKKPFIPPSVT